jgi:hypothetical protein
MSRFRNLIKGSKNDKVSPFLDADKVLETAQRCDLIEFQREKYVPWGMYIGEDCIIHLCDLGSGKGSTFILTSIINVCLHSLRACL